jgi:hypothetical protein
LVQVVQVVPHLLHLYQVLIHNLAQLEHPLVVVVVDTVAQVAVQLQVAMEVQAVVRHTLAAEIAVQ